MKDKCCAICANLQFFECPSPHFWCEENEKCPCRGDEIPDYEFSCEKYKEEEK